MQPSQAEKNRAAQAAKASIHYTAPRETPLRGVTGTRGENKMANDGENPREMMGKEWENHGKITKSWENHGKMMGNPNMDGISEHGICRIHGNWNP